MKLIYLSFLDPDQIMAADVRAHILNSADADEEVKRATIMGTEIIK